MPLVLKSTVSSISGMHQNVNRNLQQRKRGKLKKVAKKYFLEADPYATRLWKSLRISKKQCQLTINHLQQLSFLWSHAAHAIN